MQHKYQHLKSTLLIVLTTAMCSVAMEWTRASFGPRRPESSVRVESLEIVDSKGEVVARLGSNENGGTLELFRAAMGGDERLFAYIGCAFESGAELTLRDPRGESKASVGMSLWGDPMSPDIGGRGSAGEPLYSLDGHSNKGPGLHIWDRNSDEPTTFR